MPSSNHGDLPAADQFQTYDGRLNAILASVRAFPEVGISAYELRLGLPFEANSYEIRGKLSTLRGLGMVKWGANGRWYAADESESDA
jgi:hypothetical protein